MPINSARGSFSVKKHGHAMDSGVSSWIATYTYSPAPATEPKPRGIALSVNPVTSTCYLSYLVTLSYNTAWIGNIKTLSISENGTITDLTSGSSYYAFTIGNPVAFNYADPANPTARLVGHATSTGSKNRPFIMNMSNGVPTSYYIADYSGSASSSVSWVYGDYVDSLATYFYLSSIQGTDTNFGALTSTGTNTFAKYLKTAGGTLINISQIKYNPVDGFVYIAATNGSGTAPVLLKYSTAGVLQWQRQITTPSFYGWNSITFDDSGNIICFYAGNNISTVLYIASYSTSGTLNTASSTTLTFASAPWMIYPLIQKLPKQVGGGYIISGWAQGVTPAETRIIVLSSNFKVLSHRKITATATTGVLNARLLGSYFSGGSFNTRIQFDNYKNLYIPIHLNWSSVASTAPYTTYTGVLKIPLYGGGNTYTLGNSTITVADLTFPTVGTVTYTDSAASLVEFTDSTTVTGSTFGSAVDSTVPTLTRTSK